MNGGSLRRKILVAGMGESGNEGFATPARGKWPRCRANSSPEIVSKIPLGRVAEAADVADAVWYLVRPGARYVTGVTLDVNGGRYAH